MWLKLKRKYKLLIIYLNKDMLMYSILVQKCKSHTTNTEILEKQFLPFTGVKNPF